MPGRRDIGLLSAEARPWVHMDHFSLCNSSTWFRQLPSVPGAPPCMLAAFLVLAFLEGSLLVGAPAHCTEQVVALCASSPAFHLCIHRNAKVLSAQPEVSLGIGALTPGAP